MDWLKMDSGCKSDFLNIFLKSDHKCSLLMLVKVDILYISIYYVKFANICINVLTELTSTPFAYSQSRFHLNPHNLTEKQIIIVNVTIETTLFKSHINTYILAKSCMRNPYGLLEIFLTKNVKAVFILKRARF